MFGSGFYFHWFLSAHDVALNFFGADCAQVLNSRAFPNMIVRSMGTVKMSMLVLVVAADE